MGQLEPGAGEGVRQLIRVFHETLRYRPVDRVHAHRHVGRSHYRRVPLVRVVRVGNRVRAGSADRLPLIRAGGAFGQLPFVTEQVFEIVVVPLHRIRGPGAFDSARDRIAGLARAVTALPAEALLDDAGGFGFRADEGRVARAMAFAESVTAGNERHGLLVVHRHAAEGLADIASRSDRIRIAVRSFRIDVDQSHLDGAERILQFPVAAVAIVAQPGVLGAPVDVFLGLPDVRPAAGEAQCPEAHGFEGAIAGEDHQVGPGNPVAVFLLDRPEQHPRLVEIAVVRPTVDRSEALVAGSAAAAAVGDAVGARAMPGHADEKRPVMAVIRRPPVLRGRQHLADVRFQGVEIEALELLGIVEGRAHRIGLVRMLMQDFQVELIRPPVLVGRAEARREFLSGARKRAFDGVVHGVSLYLDVQVECGSRDFSLNDSPSKLAHFESFG